MSLIRVLSHTTINQIAAGEVIESPASVVKELVENALDAGASKIWIETLGGGLQKIRVADNGQGMTSEDAVLCFERHATSKLTSEEDLWNLATMGFRGEALASIASIAKVLLQTCDSLGETTEVEMEGGVLQYVRPGARSRGTTVEVRHLFFNVPARKKFQKSPSLCMADITRVVTQLSLAYPFVSFDLRHQNQEVLQAEAEKGEFLDSLGKRVQITLGEEFIKDAFFVDVTADSLRVKGILGSIQNTRPTRSLQYQFINQRAIVSPAISYAVKNAFGTRLAEDRFPIYVLHVDMPYDQVDVNVHPQKKEVRFLKEKELKAELQEKLQEALFSKETGSYSDFDVQPSFLQGSFPPPAFTQEADVFREVTPVVPLVQASLFESEGEVFLEKEVDLLGLCQHICFVRASSLAGFLHWPSEGIVLVDLKTALFRVLFESLDRASLEKNSQMLLFPISFPCSLAEAEVLESLASDLETWGFSLTRSGKQVFLVDSIPSCFREEEVLAFLREFVLQEGKGDSIEAKRQRRLATSLSRTVASTARAFSKEEAMSIVRSLLQTKSPCICPLGRKTMVYLGADDLQKQFT